MSSSRHRTPTRPRDADRGPTLLDQLAEQSTRVSLAALVAAALLGFGVFVLAFAGGDGRGDADPTAEQAGDTAFPALPLDLESVGFDTGSLVKTGQEEGPGAISYCNRRPTAEGLVAWDGNRLTAEESHQRVSQLVARFRSSLDADRYIESNSAITDCGRWTTGEEQLELTVVEREPRVLHGDDTRVFELQKLEPDPALFLETVMVRSGRDVLQLTFVSANQRDLAQLEPLTELAVEKLGL